jgi:Fe-S-cluster-containing dehydrogenase component
MKHVEADRRKRAMATGRPGVIIAVDYEKRIGCKYCIVSCPYGARLSDEGEFFTRNW